MDQMNLLKEQCFQVGEQVFVEATGNSPGFHTYVVGFKPPLCLILEHPLVDSWAHRLKVNDGVWVRCFRDKLIRFRTRIVRILKEPIPLIFVEYPKTVEHINLRRSERKKVFLKGIFLDLKEKRPDRTWEGYILDISDTGCLMWGDFVHLVDREVLLNFTVPWTRRNIQAKARVVRCEVTEKGMKSGLQFLDLDEDTKKGLQELLQALEERTPLSKLIEESGK